MGNEAIAPANEDLEFAIEGRAFLEAHGAGELADRQVEIVHGDGTIYRGTIADAIGGRCPEFRTMAESLVEVGGAEILTATVNKYVEKTELKKKS